MLIANRLFHGGKIAAITLAVVLVFQVCCFGQLPAENVTIAVAAPDSSCHDELPAAPEAPVSPAPSHSCCIQSHSQDAVVAAIYTPPQIPATWFTTEAGLLQTASLASQALVSAKSTGPPGTLALRI